MGFFSRKKHEPPIPKSVVLQRPSGEDVRFTGTLVLHKLFYESRFEERSWASFNFDIWKTTGGQFITNVYNDDGNLRPIEIYKDSGELIAGLIHSDYDLSILKHRFWAFKRKEVLKELVKKGIITEDQVPYEDVE